MVQEDCWGMIFSIITQEVLLGLISYCFYYDY